MDQRKRERESTFSSSNETQSSYLPSLPAPKPLSVALFPTSATLQSHHPFRHAAVPPKLPFPLQSLPTGYPAHSAQVSLTRPLTQLSQSLNFARALRLQEKHDGHSQCQAVGEFLFTHSLPSAWPGGREQSLCGCIINHKASVSQLFIKG